MEPRMVVEVIRGIVIVRITPALVPTHNRSLHTISDVIRKQAALCCLMMSSAAVIKITTQLKNHSHYSKQETWGSLPVFMHVKYCYERDDFGEDLHCSF